MSLKESLKAKGVAFAIYGVIVLIIFNAVLFFYYASIQKQLENERQRASVLVPKVEQVKDDITAAEFAAQRYMLTKSADAVNQYGAVAPRVSRDLDSLTYHLQRLSTDEGTVARIDESIKKLIQLHEQFLSAIQSADSTGTVTGFSQLEPTFQSADRILEGVTNENSQRASSSIASILTVTSILLIAGIPFLLLLIASQRKSKARLLELNRNIEESNRKYVFNALDDVDYSDDQVIKARLLSNLEKASAFIQQVASGNYAIQWDGITDQNREVNKDNIAGELIRMREQMKHVKEQDEMRIWTTEGLSMFGEIIRKHQDNFESLGDNFISNVVKYLKAKVGGLFILEEGDDQQQFLELKAAYAYDRKKFISKRVEIGEGLIGQTFLEGQTIHMKEVPNEYLVITSGLGGSNPKSMLLVPLRTNERIEGVLELASFNEFKPHEIEFLEKLGEQLASSVISVRTSTKTRSLLEVSQQQSEEMRAQEEEMRQNMEELEATQEQMHRQMNEVNALKQRLEEEQYLFAALMGNMPDSIYFKDKESKFLRISAYMAKHFDATEEALIGKSDFDFQDEAHAREAFEDEKNIMATRKAKIDYVEKETKADGTEHYVSTTKMPLINLHGEVVGTFGISRDVTAFKTLEKEVRKKEQDLKGEEQRHRLKIKELEDALDEAEKELAKLKKNS